MQQHPLVYQLKRRKLVCSLGIFEKAVEQLAAFQIFYFNILLLRCSSQDNVQFLVPTPGEKMLLVKKMKTSNSDRWTQNFLNTIAIAAK